MYVSIRLGNSTKLVLNISETFAFPTKHSEASLSKRGMVWAPGGHDSLIKLLLGY